MGGGVKKRVKNTIHGRTCVHKSFTRPDPCGKPVREDGPNGWLCPDHDFHIVQEKVTSAWREKASEQSKGEISSHQTS
jgi:hypothetical protein